MKTLLFIINLFIATNSFAQLPVWIQVTGKPETKLILQQKYSKEEMVEKFGALVSYTSFFDDEIYQADIQQLEFKDLVVETVDNKINQFNFGGNRLELRMECWNMTIKPGDDINLYRNLPKDKAYKVENYGEYLRVYPIINDIHYDEQLILYYDKDKKIRTIEWFVPV